MPVEKTASNNALKGLQWGMHCALINGEIVRDIPSEMVYVSSQSELSNFTNIMPVGTFAAKYGLSKAWQLKDNRTWEEVW